MYWTNRRATATLARIEGSGSTRRFDLHSRGGQRPARWGKDQDASDDFRAGENLKVRRPGSGVSDMPASTDNTCPVTQRASSFVSLSAHQVL